MSNRFYSALKQVFASFSGHKRKVCAHCGGGRCIGACGNTFTQLSQHRVQGELRLFSNDTAVVVCEEEIVLTFQTNTHFGRMILKKCPPGTQCEIIAMTHNNQLEKLISIQRI